MISLAEQVAEKMKAFPPEQQQEVLLYVEFLATKLNVDSQTEKTLQKPRLSMQEAMDKYAGCLDGGPPDLSSNKDYMQGFGEV